MCYRNVIQLELSTVVRLTRRACLFSAPHISNSIALLQKSVISLKDIKKIISSHKDPPLFFFVCVEILGKLHVQNII